MFDKQLYTTITETWRDIKRKVNIDHIYRNEDINIFDEHNVMKTSHIEWSIPLTLYQLASSKKETIRLVEEYNYKVVLFCLAYIYIKYHDDFMIDILNVGWQLSIIEEWKNSWDFKKRHCNYIKKRVKKFHRLEMSLLELMEYRFYDYAMDDDKLYRRYYGTIDKNERKNILVSTVFSKYFRDVVLKELTNNNNKLLSN